MDTNFVNTLMGARKKASSILLIIVALSLVASIVFNWNCYIVGLGLLALVLTIVVNCITIVMPGNAGYLITLGHLAEQSYSAGIHFIIPFISQMTEVDIRLKKHEDTDTMKSSEQRLVKLKYIFTYQVNEKYVYLLHKTIGEDKYMTEALCPWLNAVFTSIVTSLKYDDLNGKLKVLSDQVTTEFTDYVHDRCRALCNYRPIDMFTNIKVNILEVKFDDEYEKAVAETAKAVQEQAIAKAKGEQLKIAAEANAEATALRAKGEAEALRIKAEAEAEAMKLKGATENEVRERLGEILNTHPELIKEVLAKNFPKVFGGNTMINLDQILGS